MGQEILLPKYQVLKTNHCLLWSALVDCLLELMIDLLYSLGKPLAHKRQSRVCTWSAEAWGGSENRKFLNHSLHGDHAVTKAMHEFAVSQNWSKPFES